MKNVVTILVTLVTVCLAACTEAPPAGPSGAELLTPFKSEMQQALKAGMAEGPVKAIDACRLRAPEIAKALSVDGVKMGRTSHKLRNAANDGPDWARAILDEYLASDAEPEPVTRSLGNGRAGHVEPIFVQPLCVVCHGEALAPDLAAAIAEAYPDDEATGFRPGDLRGVFWVEYPETQ